MNAMEITPNMVAVVGGILTILTTVAGVIYKFARNDERAERFGEHLAELSVTVKDHIGDKTMHHDARAFEDFRENTDRRFNEQKIEIDKINAKLDILIGFKR